MSIIRAATLADWAAIDGIHRRNGFGPLDSFSWENLCLHHPYQSLYPGSPPAWVIEDDSAAIVGSLINIPLPADFEGQRVRAVASGSWGVDEQHRNLMALGLMREWFRQADAEMWLIGTANHIATQLMGAFRTERIPLPHYLDSLFWILDSRKFVEAVLRKKRVPAPGLFSGPGGAALACYSRIIGHGGGKGRVSIKAIDAFDHRFDDFWNKLRTGVPRVRVLRDRAMLEWRFASNRRRNGLTILTATEGGAMTGYAVLTAQSREHLGLEQNIVADLQALDDKPEVLDSLLAAAISESKAQGKHALELQGYHATKYQIALKRRPFHYSYSVWPLYYRCRDKERHKQLASAAYWDFGPLDSF